jgi:Protein of unknown function (DUF1552)
MSRFHRTVLVKRRQFLRGTGATLALPFLPSLVPEPAYGLSFSLPVRRRYVTTFSMTGCIRRSSFFPSDESAPTTFPIAAGMVGHRGPLQSRIEGNDRVISDVLRAPSSKFSAALVTRMNVLSGLDVPVMVGHHFVHPGGYYRYEPLNGAAAPKPVPTVDQIIAWSKEFYGRQTQSPNPVVRRSLVDDRAVFPASYFHANPMARTGEIVPSERFNDQSSSRALFDSLFGNPKPAPPSADLRRSILDRVTQRWKSLRQSNRRMSTADRVRLDHHLEQLRDLEMRIGLQDPLVCIATKPLEDTKAYGSQSSRDEIKRFGLMNDLIAMAFSCDVTRVVMQPHTANFVDYTGSWDQDILDGSAGPPGTQAVLTKSLQATFEHTLLDLTQKLDQQQGDGTSLLDQCLLQWTQAFGSDMHFAVSMPVVTVGSGGYAIETGRYFDFRNRSRIPQNVSRDTYGYGSHTPGIHYGRWLRTLLDAMGVDHNSYDMTPFLNRDLKNMPKQYVDALLPGQLDSAEAILEFLPTLQ